MATKKFDLNYKITWSQIDRTNLVEKIDKYWRGHHNSVVGLQYLKFKDGTISSLDGLWERRDIYLGQLYDENIGFVGNIFITPYINNDVYSTEQRPYVSIQGSNIEFDDDEKKQLLESAYKYWTLEENQEHIEKHIKFFNEKPWLQCDGFNPSQAIKKLESLGW